MRRFILNGKEYLTDPETLQVLRSIIPSAKATGDGSAVMAMVFLGMRTGRIQVA